MLDHVTSMQLLPLQSSSQTAGIFFMIYTIMLKHLIIRRYRSSESVTFYHHLIQCIFNEIQEIIYGYAMDMPWFRQLAASLPHAFEIPVHCPFHYLK